LARNKDKNEIEHLRGELREAMKENRALRRRLKTVEKDKNIWTQYSLDSDEPEVPVTILQPTCPQCKRGNLVLTDLGIKNLLSCALCGYRLVKLKNG
jgi:hypothetical protein